MTSLVVNLKLKCLLKMPTHNDIIEAKEVYIQQSFERYKGNLVLRNKSPSVYNKYQNLLGQFTYHLRKNVDFKNWTTAKAINK